MGILSCGGICLPVTTATGPVTKDSQAELKGSSVIRTKLIEFFLY